MMLSLSKVREECETGKLKKYGKNGGKCSLIFFTCDILF
jgi:hypothetical protein